MKMVEINPFCSRCTSTDAAVVTNRLSILLSREVIGPLICDGGCEATFCDYCIQFAEQCVIDCDFTCAHCCGGTYCYVLGGPVCRDCEMNHDDQCGCTGYNDDNDDFIGNFIAAEDEKSQEKS